MAATQQSLISLFNSAGMSGEDQRDEGMERVLRKRAAQIYKGHLEAALFTFPVGWRFTAENLTAVAGRPPVEVHYNAVGAIISGMGKRGLIRKTGRMLRAQRAVMHATELAEWELVKYPERNPERYECKQ